MTYHILKQIEEGSYGTVSYCRKNGKGKMYACKIFKKEGDKTKKGWKECEILEKCSNPNIMRIYSYFYHDEQLCMIMELCDMDFFTYMENNLNTNADNIASKMIQICLGLKYLHNMNIIHRDIKPENILVKGNVLKLCDFNFAEEYNPNEKKKFQFTGTLDYMCPEILFDGFELYGPEIDIWAVGVILYVFCTSALPFNLTKKPTKKDFNIDKVLDDVVDKHFRKIISKCFSKYRRYIYHIEKDLRKTIEKRRIKLIKSNSI